MQSGKEIRSRIKSVENTRKITKAMEMVAASKMRKVQERMRAARPYSSRVRNIAGHLSEANPEYRHPLMVKHKTLKRVGLIVVTTDKGLCGGMNANVLRTLTQRMREFEKSGVACELMVVGSKGLSFLSRIGAKIIAQVTQLGDVPHLDRLVGPAKVLLDGYQNGDLDAIHVFYTRFVNSMQQEPVSLQLVPLSDEELRPDPGAPHHWDYLYEPDAQTVIDELLIRYLEALMYQALAENMASEQSARRMAMKAASDNAGSVIDELRLVYNKTRQAAITTEISEIVSGAAAV
ncbi:F0F1 ATP synthase subunit gamma [Noviherbaspirillum pedocola]|uniref:ATP synthase gamma chain n=1 Tax=Noviherbaspirillum pedocola TaxID=2801341 RepID=A0A934SWM1_9BURK|nr:F0F1 ATP synthase subunit gamma [Noviherbaspirillum pedocola]MBK4736773.1 F0F1 ATP synthase subunit gamma [Noviherbaspirillum pedocola]